MRLKRYSGKMLVDFYAIKVDSHGNPIDSKLKYVEDYYSEELHRPEFVAAGQPSALEDVSEDN